MGKPYPSALSSQSREAPAVPRFGDQCSGYWSNMKFACEVLSDKRRNLGIQTENLRRIDARNDRLSLAKAKDCTRTPSQKAFEQSSGCVVTPVAGMSVGLAKMFPDVTVRK